MKIEMHPSSTSVPNIHRPNIQVREHSRIFVEYTFGKWANILNIHEYSQNPSKSVKIRR